VRGLCGLVGFTGLGTELEEEEELPLSIIIREVILAKVVSHRL